MCRRSAAALQNEVVRFYLGHEMHAVLTVIIQIRTFFYGEQLDVLHAFSNGQHQQRFQLQPEIALDRLFVETPYITTVTSKQKWGNTVFKYLPNEVAEQILRDLRSRLTGQEKIQKFYEYFCTCNHLEPAARKA